MRKQLFCCVCIRKVGLNLNGGEFQMPNAKVLSEKQAIVAELTEKLKTASSGVLVDYKGITVAQDTALRALIERADRPTAIVVSDDLLGVTLERVCLTHGLSIPEDISIISFNNSLFAKLTSPRLTSVDLNSFQLGIEAASQLISHIDHPELMATKSIIPHRIVERESCGTRS